MTADFKENIRSVAYRADQELLYLEKLRFTITAYQDEEQKIKSNGNRTDLRKASKINPRWVHTY